MGDLVVAMTVVTWTRWVDLKVAAQSRSGLLTRWTIRLRGGLLMAVRLALGWVIHWVGDNEEWVGRVGWVGEDEGWVGEAPSPCST